MPLRSHYFAGLTSWWFRRQRKRHTRAFAHACRRLFQGNILGSGDQVFLPTMSEVDFLGLAEFLQLAPETAVADWHLQFHFDLFDGREPAYKVQTERDEIVRRQFVTALRKCADRRVHLYTTTDKLAGQYNRLKVARFQYLPYPVNPAVCKGVGAEGPASRAAVRSPSYADRPLRITCAGAIRREKNQRLLIDLIGALAEDHSMDGKLQFLVQSNKRWLRFRSSDRREKRKAIANRSTMPVVYVRHPLKTDEYVRFIRSADVGLFLYDSDRYYARHAGVLGEFLAAGRPVIVPAGCWLAEQIVESIYKHQEDMLQQLPEVGRLRCEDATWKPHVASRLSTIANRVIAFRGRLHSAQHWAPILSDASEAVITFHWNQPAPGTYIRLHADQYDADGNLVDNYRAVLGPHPTGRLVPLMLHLDSRGKRLQLTWENAYHDGTIKITDLQITFLRAREKRGEHCPTGAVGLIAADIRQIPQLLREMQRHYSHYRQTAEAFSHDWMQKHHPQVTMTHLLDRGRKSATLGPEAA